MKKAGLLCVLISIFCFSACSTTINSINSQSAGSTLLQSSFPDIIPSQNTTMPSSLQGIYYETSYMPDSKEYSHYIELRDDNRFEMRVNLAAAMGKITGSYSQNSNTVDCVVEQVHFSGFAGDDITSFSFTVIDETHLEYHGAPIAYIEDGNVFEKDRFGVESPPFLHFFHGAWGDYFYAWRQGANETVTIPSWSQERGRGADADVFMGENGSDITITAGQQLNIIGQLKEIADGYRTGIYPSGPEHPDFGYDYAPFSAPWPPNVPMEIVVQPSDIYYSTGTNNMDFYVGVYFLLDDYWIMCASIFPYPHPFEEAQNDDYWTVSATYYFINSKGEVLDYRAAPWFPWDGS